MGVKFLKLYPISVQLTQNYTNAKKNTVGGNTVASI